MGMLALMRFPKSMRAKTARSFYPLYVDVRPDICSVHGMYIYNLGATWDSEDQGDGDNLTD